MLQKIELFLVSIGIFFLSTAYCAEVDSLSAKSVAENFYLARLSQSSIRQLKSIPGEVEMVLIHQEYDHPTGIDILDQNSISKPLYYIFNVKDNNGFVIVSGDDRIIPVLGYAFSGEYSKYDHSPAFDSWMSNYKKQIKSLPGGNLKASFSVQQEWSKYLTAPAVKSGIHINEVLPLLSTTWNQGCYYNDLCPVDDDGSCNHAYAGCTAVTLAQIMKYWNHPVSSNRIPGYFDDYNEDEDDLPIDGSDYGCLPDIDGVNYDWSKMTDKLTSKSTDHEVFIISELLYNAGVASHMNFGPDGSSAFTWDAYNALISYFNYSPSLEFVLKSDYTDESWGNLIIEELDNQRPVYYVGYGTGGHAFVCDGYQNSNYFHFNWGWGGYDDGYFYLSELNPGTADFSENQHAIIGIEPEINQPDPYDNIIEINGSGADHIQSFTGGGLGAWDLSNCGYYTPGKEQVYSFNAPETGLYSIEVLSARGDVDYSWRESNCGEPGWSCIDDVLSKGSYGILSWTGGSTYHILLDDEDSNEGLHQFYMNYLGEPELKFSSYEIDDDNKTSSGNNNGRAEPGESLELMITLINTGSGDTHDVSAVISTTDPDITISDDYETYEDIPAGAGMVCKADFDFSITSSCPVNKEVTFTLEITSDEGTWTDQFIVRINPPPPMPCEHVISINGHGSENSQIFSGESGGAWNSGDCGFNTPGTEQVYSFSAPDTGLYTIEVISAIGSVNYSWQTSGCSETGWNCLHHIDSEGTFGLISWTGGTTYYILLDAEENPESVNQFFIKYLGRPELGYNSHVINDDNNPGSGKNNGLAEPGETIIMMLTLDNIGNGDGHNVSAVISVTDPDISIKDDNEMFGDITAGGSGICEACYEFSISPGCPGDRDVTFTLDITSDEGTWTDQFVVHVYPLPPDPCENMLSINGCGSVYSQTFTGGGEGSWNAGSCGFDTPGAEQVYSFVAPDTGFYSIQVVSASGDVAYSWQSSGCGETGWNCIQHIDSAGTFGLVSWTGGTTYYILLDDKDNTEGVHQFYINNLGRPELTYYNHDINDDNNSSPGNNNGLAEPGESIKMMLTMDNSSNCDVHNVSAVISSTDPDISISDDYEIFGDITAGGSGICSAGYEFSISSSCPGDRDVSFALDINSDEGTWTDQFVVHIHKNITSAPNILMQNKFNIYPNPTEELLYLKSESIIESQLIICLRDNLGRTIYEQTYGYLLMDEIIHINLSNYSRGIYFLQIYYLNKIHTERIIKQ